MTDSQTHLKSAIEQRDAIVKEIQELNAQVATKRELGLKVQGIIEYLLSFPIHYSTRSTSHRSHENVYVIFLWC